MVTRSYLQKKGNQKAESRSKSSHNRKKCMKDHYHAKTTDIQNGSKNLSSTIGKVLNKINVFITYG